MSKPATLIGLIGGNILKSLSPALHEDAFLAHRMRGYYHLMDLDKLPGRRLEHILAAVKTLGFAGVNVTFPVKQAILPLLDEVSEEAMQIGAVNTVKIDSDGRATGYNTDRSGFRRNFEERLGTGVIAGKRVLMVGAGGAGRAVAFALMDLGAAHLVIHDSDASKVNDALADLSRHYGAARCSSSLDLPEAMADASGIVNATPVGMLGIPGNPVPAAHLRPEHFVADVIYTPLETELIKAARALGCPTLTGGGMCVHQAADAFRLFTGREPDIARMHQAFADALAQRDAALRLAAQA